MIFTRLGKVAAWICIVFGAFAIAMFFAPFPPEAGIATPTGKRLEIGVYSILIGLFLGVFCEISSHLRAARKAPHTKEGQG